jgi:pimeloyl-ACP methyl ester carboxylesterase
VPDLHVETIGSGPRVVLVHGSVHAGGKAWQQQQPLAEKFTLVVVDRSGYPPNPPLPRIDFEKQADEIAALLAPGDHLVGHSYGGVVSLLAAARASGRVRSLTVVEPPAFGVARGNPAVEELLAKMETAPREPREYLDYFLPLVGSALTLPDPLPPSLEAGARAAMAERPPHEAEVPLDDLAEAPFPKLVVSGAHNAALDSVADVLEERLRAQRVVLPGSGHTIQRLPGFNDALVRFLETA